MRMGWEARAALYDKAHGRPVDAEKIVRESAQEFVDYLLFIDEAPLPAPIQSAAVLRSSAYAKAFTGLGPFDRKGRSLRGLDLQHRLLRYPCSYMIYSEAFDGLPASAKAAIYARLWQVLSGVAEGDKYKRLNPVLHRHQGEYEPHSTPAQPKNGQTSRKPHHCLLREPSR